MRELEAMIAKCATIGGMQRSMLTFAMYLFLTPGALCADAPVAKVPHASIPVRLDGRVNEAEWRDAAIIRGALGNPGTAVYLKYDQESMWVGVRCFETKAGYPKAYARQPTDLLENDDSVQVVLGTTDSNERRSGRDKLRRLRRGHWPGGRRRGILLPVHGELGRVGIEVFH